MYDYGFKMGDIVGSNDFYQSFAVDVDNPSKYSARCPCGKGAKVDDDDNDENDPLEIIDGALDIDDSTSDYYDVDKCKSDNIGIDGTDGWGDKTHGVLGKYSAGNWPYTWGCEFGALKPKVQCKHANKDYAGGKKANPCYKGSTAVKHGQTAAFVSIVIVQWADLLICKTRSLSLHQQGMSNIVMLYGLLTETLLCLVLCYVPGVEYALGTQPLLAIHWFPSFPFSMFIFFYDEVRKYIIRQHRLKFDGQAGWLEEFTYY